MSNLKLKEKWTRWYPERIYLKNIEKKYKTLYFFNQFRKEDFYTDLNNKEKHEENDSQFKISLKEKLGYENGLKKGFSESQEKSILLINQLNNLLLDCENSLAVFEDTLSSRLRVMALRIAAYVIRKKVDIDEVLLMKYVKKIIAKDGIFLKKPKLIVHSNNKTLLEKTLKDFFKNYKWTLVCDDSLDLNGCKVESESGYIDATVDARWQEVCRLIDSEEC